MRDIKIATSLVKLINVLECRIDKKINCHGSAVITGHIKSNKEEELVRKLYGETTWGNLTIMDENGKEEEIFSGIVKSAEIEYVGGLKKVTICLVGNTLLLDCKKRTRTFQDQSMTYDEVLTSAEKENDGIHIMRTGGGEEIKDIIVQYRETNWEFIKRMASRHNSFAMPYYKGQGVRYYIGLDTYARAEKIQILEYRMVNNLEEYLYKKRNKVENIVEQDAITYQVKSRDFVELGAGVEVQGRVLYVYQSHAELTGGELIHTYQLRSPGGFQQVVEYNTRLIGASLEGYILETKADQVKVCITVDGSQDKETAKWFSYSTVYSSPDGSGWYCMPEENDRVRLYFPSEKEEEGYIISSIHVGGGVSADDSDGSGNGSLGGSGDKTAPRTNPDNKSIMNKYNKQLELTPTSITMTNNKGMSICLDDNEGISIISDKDVIIKAKENMSLISLTDSMSMEAKESIKMVQGDAKITVKEEITVEGALMKIQ